MTDEELDQWRGQEAWRLRHEYPEDATEVIAARLAREGRTPPEPVVDPDLLIAREAAAQQWERHYGDKIEAQRRRDGWCDTGQAVTACRIAARMAREQERGRANMPIGMAGVLVDRCQRMMHSLPPGVRAQWDAEWGLVALCREVAAEIAKYMGEA